MPLVFHRTTVDKEDIPRLDEGECLNDNLIGFGLRYLFDRFLMRHPDLNKRVYLHNSFFYAKLKAGRNAINYEGVKSWTAKVDLLAYDYIVVPVNEHYHWWVAIICNPGKLDPDFRKSHRKNESPEDAGRADTAQPNQDLCEASPDVEMTEMTESMQSRNHTMTDGRRDPDLIRSDIVDLEDLASTGTPHGRKSGPIARRHNPEDPRIITLDSMGVSHPQAVSHLKKYILAEFEHKRGKVFTEIPQLPGMKAVNIPQQNNFCDCGVYLLGYIQEFVRDPDRFIQVLLQREVPDWDFKPAVLRELWRDTIKEERDRYQKTQESERIKREGSAGKRTPTVKAKPETHSSRANSEAFDISKDKQGRKTAWSERSGSAKIASSPTDAQEFGDSSEAGSDQHKDTKDHVPSSAPTLGQASQQLASQQDAPDEVILLSPRKNGVLPSIEAPEVEELPGRQDEPAFIAKLPTSPPRPSDDGHIVEVPPSTFYRSNSAKSRKVSTRPSLTPSSVRQHTKAVKTQPAAHTESRFVLDDDDIPVVQRAELVRQSDTIDLTD
jgi:sentrin-specific protease 7